MRVEVNGMNPWENIDLDVYEKHMSLEEVSQLQALNQRMKVQLSDKAYSTVMILGIAGGNGLEHVSREQYTSIYGVDINGEYLKQCEIRYPMLKDCFHPVQVDLMQEEISLPHVEYVIANLVVEYIGYEHFQHAIAAVAPEKVSCVIQVNGDQGFVSSSPYLHAFDELEQVHVPMEESVLIQTMENIGYCKTEEQVQGLPNGKKLVQMDFRLKK